MTAQLAVNALRSAIARRQPSGTVVVHSDRGSQFRSRAFRAVLTAAGLPGSMGRVAAAGDNAAMESFYSLLQKNVLNRRRWSTRDELRYAIVTWIEHTYNRRRRQRALGKLTPVEFELAFTPHADARRWQHDQLTTTVNRTRGRPVHAHAVDEERSRCVAVVVRGGYTRGGEPVPDGDVVEHPRAQRPRVVLAALGLRRVEVHAVRERRAQQ